MARYPFPLVCLLALLLHGPGQLLVAVEEPAAGPAPTPALWTASKGDDTVHLFGSIHVGSEAMYPIPEAVDEAFASSEALALEIDMITKAMEAAAVMATKAYYQDGDDMTKHLDAESLALLKEFLGKRNVDFEMVKTTKPWYLVQSIMMGEILQMGFRMDLGIDMHFGKRAQARGKPILELESIRDQVTMLDELDQDVMVQFTLGPLEEGGEMLEQMVDTWVRGDVAALAKLAVEEPLAEYPDIAPFYETFLFERNATMVASIERHMQTYDEIFVVVGAAHLVGERSVVDLMAQAGWTVEQETGAEAAAAVP